MEKNDIKDLEEKFSNDEFPQVQGTINNDQHKECQQHEQEW